MELKGKKYHHCSFCDYKCVLKSSLESHYQCHTGERPFLCDRDQCKRGFASKSYLRLHIQRAHQGLKKEYEKKYKCSLCPYATYATCALEAHIQIHHEERSFPCQHPGCQYTGKSSHYLRKHNAYKHQNNERKFLCQFPNCAYRGKTMVDIRNHSVTHREDRPFVCDFEGCSYQAKSKGALRVHKLNVHHGGHKPFTCSLCNHSTTSKYKLTTHERIHTEEKLVKCSFIGCTYSCKFKRYLNQHFRNCHTEKTFKCDFAGCSSTAASQSMLKLHKKSVHGEKIYKCSICDHTTATASNMRVHVDRHKASRNIACPTKGCTFLTTRHEYLYQHMKYHKSCLVEGCAYVAHSSSGLKNHMQRHDPTGRPFRCPLCPQYFPTNGHLSSHLRSHTQEKPFKCPQCDFAAANNHSIKQHVRAIHRTFYSKFDDESICDHCNIDFGSAMGLAIHKINLKTALVVLTRLHVKRS